MTPKTRKKFWIWFFKVLDVFFWGLKASPVAWTSVKNRKFKFLIKKRKASHDDPHKFSFFFQEKTTNLNGLKIKYNHIKSFSCGSRSAAFGSSSDQDPKQVLYPDPQRKECWSRDQNIVLCKKNLFSAISSVHYIFGIEHIPIHV